jgi:RNA polymerase sigma-70 factor (ECF subfamily)
VGNADGFDEFYRATCKRMVAYLFAVGGDRAEAQDAAHEAYARAWQHWDQVEHYGDPERWVRNVGWRIQVNRWRKVRGRLAAYRRHGVPEPLPPLKEDTIALVAALRQIPAAQRVALVLHHVLDLPIAEVAQQTGSSVGAVKVRLSRGRHALAKILGTTEPETYHV